MPASPLPVGTVLADRFELLDVLDQGLFTTTYQARDRMRRDLCVVKELAPEGAERDEQDVLDLAPLGVGAQHLRTRFLDEVRRVGRLHLPSILPVRSTFSERGTAFYVVDYLDGAVTLEQHILEEGRMAPPEVLQVIPPLLDTLQGLHEKGIVHKDVRPENLLLTPRGKLILVGPGGAKEWLADAREAHDVFFDSPYAPLEQTTDRLDRGPASDVYSLSATLYFMLMGVSPVSAMERSTGAELPSIHKERQDVDRQLDEGILDGMSIQYLERPQSIRELRRVLEPNDGFEDAEERLERLDQLIGKLRKFSFEKRECPSCNGVLETPEPLKKGKCPVCHDGEIKLRELSERLCPVCHGGVLKPTKNEGPLVLCPVCRHGRLKTGRKSLFSKQIVSTCEDCEAFFEVENGSAKLVQPEPKEGEEAPVKSWEEWRVLSGRPQEFLACDSCDAQYEAVGDGRLAQIVPSPARWRALYPEEWAKVAAGLEPVSGNAECTSCRADYHLEGDKVTLLAAHRDPFGFAERHRGRLLKMDDLRWKGAGKESTNPGLVCADCQTELDFEGEDLRLIRSGHSILRKFVGHTKSLEDWHRLAQGLPENGLEHSFDQEFDKAVAHAYESGTVSLDEKGDLAILWKGPAIRLEEKKDQLVEGREGQLLITDQEISFGGRLRKWRLPLSALNDVSAEENVLTMTFDEESSPVLFELTPVEFTIKLEHSERTLELNALNLALRLEREIRTAKRGVLAAR